MIDLPESVVGATERPEQHSLAYRDLERGVDCDLPSGEAVARLIGSTPLSADALGLRELGWKGETPLWFYILREADVQCGGERLGEVGGRISAVVPEHRSALASDATGVERGRVYDGRPAALCGRGVTRRRPHDQSGTPAGPR